MVTRKAVRLLPQHPPTGLVAGHSEIGDNLVALTLQITPPEAV